MKTVSRRSPLRWLALPWWTLQIFTGAKSFCDNPVIGSKRLNRLGLYNARIRLAHWLAAGRRSRLDRRLSAANRAHFAEHGYVQIPDFMPADAFEALRDALLTRAAPAREMVQGDTITRRIAIDAAMLRDVPALKALIREPRWAGLMRYVASFNIEPLYYIQTILTHRRNAPRDPQTNLHADTFHPTMKAWFFLTDVSDEDGPLTYVPGSHKMTPQRLAWEKQRALVAPEGLDHLSARGSMRITPEELPLLDLPQPVRFAVSANTLVVADTCGFHARGAAARPSIRVEIWAYSRRSPFILWPGLDLLSLPGIAERRIGWMWALRDRFRQYLGQPWAPVGETTPISHD